MATRHVKSQKKPLIVPKQQVQVSAPDLPKNTRDNVARLEVQSTSAVASNSFNGL